MRLVSVEGSNINLYRNPNDKETHIANSTHCGHNAMHPSTTFNLLNQTYLDAIIQPANGKDERGAILEMVPNLPENSILIADSGYESYNLFAHLGNRNLKYLIQVKDINSNGIAFGFELPDTEFDVDLVVNISNKQSIKIKQIENYRFSPSIARFDFSDDENPVYNLNLDLLEYWLKTANMNVLFQICRRVLVQKKLNGCIF